MKTLTEKQLFEARRKGKIVGKVNFAPVPIEDTEENPMRTVEGLLAEVNRRLAVLGESSSRGMTGLDTSLTGSLREVVAGLRSVALSMQAQKPGDSMAVAIPLLEQISRQLEANASQRWEFKVKRDGLGHIEKITAIKEK